MKIEPPIPHFHKDERGVLVKCYHSTKNLLSQPSFWIGTTLGYPLEHFLWEHVWPFSIIGHYLLGH